MMLGETIDGMEQLCLDDPEALEDYIKLLQAASELVECWPQFQIHGRMECSASENEFQHAAIHAIVLKCYHAPTQV